MRSLLIIALVFATVFGACKKSSASIPDLTGTYSGTFIKNGDTANLTITFTPTTFTGTANQTYLTICSGIYTQTANTLTFSNDCRAIPSVNYLSGDFSYSLNNNRLTITKTLNGETGYYNLTR